MRFGPVALLSTVLALFGASQSSAVIILGGGNPTTDCLSVFDVNANVLPTKPTRIDCIDGDPACDTDGACGNGCNFSVRLCLNATTPSCSPSALKKKPTVKKGAGLTAPDSTGTASSCGDYENVTVPLQRNGKKYGQKRIEVLAVGSDNRKDRDELILRCVPRVGACPTTTTTTSTTSSTAPTVSTTSTTIASTTSTIASTTTSTSTTSTSSNTTATTSSTTTSTTTASSSTTSTSTSSTTTSTEPSSCGNGIVDPNEECDPNTPEPSCTGSAVGGFVCDSGCHCVPPSTTTSSTTSTTQESTTSTIQETTTTSSSSTTSSTTASTSSTSTSTTSSTTTSTEPTSCGNGFVDPNEECDPNTPEPSCAGSAGGGFICDSTCHCVTSTTSTSSTTSTTAQTVTTTSTTESTTTSTQSTTSSTSSSTTTSSSSSTSSSTSTTSTSSSTTTSSSSSTSSSTSTTSTSTSSTIVTTTSTSSSSTTSTSIAPCCDAVRITTNSPGGGTLKVGGFAPFPFPPGVTVIIDAGAPDAQCKHDAVVPAGGFVVPPFCIPALQYTSQVTVNGCASGNGLGTGVVWDGHTAAHGGTPMANISKVADSSDGVCDTSGPSLACANRDTNFTGDIDTTRSVGGDGTKVVTSLDIPAHSRTWQDAAGCPGNGVFDVGEGDTLITEFDFILSPTTGVATGAFVDKNADGCALPAGSAGFGANSAQCSGQASSGVGPCSATGIAAAGPCCVVGQNTTTATVGMAFSNSFPLYDLGFINVIPSSITGCGTPGSDTCTLPSDHCLQ